MRPPSAVYIQFYLAKRIGHFALVAAGKLCPPVASLMVSMVFRLGPSPPLPFSLLTSELGAPRRVLAAILVPSSDVSTYSSQLEQP